MDIAIDWGNILCFSLQRDSRHFVVGTNAQKQLLVYTLHDDNILKPTSKNIVSKPYVKSLILNTV